MSLQYSPKITQDGLVMCLDASQNKSYPIDLPVKDRLNLWLDAADDTTFSYSSGTTVSQWRDKSGQNNHAIVNGGSPVRSVAINSRKAVSFTSTSWFKCTTGTFASNATHFLVCRATTSSATYQRVYNGGSDGYLFFGALANNIATFWGTLSSGWIDVSVNSPSITILNTLRIISAINNGSTGTPYYDGTAMSTKTTTNSFGYTGYELNSYSNGIISQPLIGEVCEIIVFNKQLSTTELKQVHTYLGQKWGISNTDRSIIDLSGLDDSGLLGNGTTANMPVFDYYNKGSLSFDGSNDYITIPSSASIKNTSSLTLEAWVYISNSMNYYGGIFGKGTTDIDEEYCLLVHSVNSKVYMDVGSTGGPYTDATFSFSLNTWYHIIGTHERISGSSTIKIYVNGSLLSSSTVGATSAVNDNSTAATIGSRFSTGASFWNGKIANAKIYTRTLSAAEVAQNYEAQKSKFANTIVQQGLVLNLDAGNPYSYAGAGTTWIDVSGNSYNGTLTNGPTYSSVNGGIINFDGVDDYSISTVTSIPASSTIAIWIKSSSYNNKIPISINEDSYGSGPNLYFISSQICWNTGDSASNPFTNSSYPDSNWHYIVVTNDSSTNAKLYIDGILIGTAAYRSTLSTTSNNFWIGRFHGDNNYTINASIGQVQLYNRVLSAAEVLQNYNATKGRFGL